MALTPYTRAYGNLPLTQITPFTYRDGLTFLQILNEFERWLREIVPEIDGILEGWTEKYLTDHEALKNEIVNTKNQWQQLFDDFMADVVLQLEGLNDQAVANLVNSEASKIREALNDHFIQANDGVEFYVNPVTGSNTSNGSSSAPFKTVQHAINEALKTASKIDVSHVIHLSSGVYSERPRFPSHIAYPYSLEIRGADVGGQPFEPTTIFSEGNGAKAEAFINNNRNASITFKDIAFNGYNGTGSSGGITNVRGEFILDNCHFTNCYYGASSFTGDLRIPNSVFTNCGYLHAGGGQGAAIRSIAGNRHFIGIQNNGNRVNTTLVQDSYRGALVQENCSGHFDWATIRGCERGIAVIGSARVNASGTLFEDNFISIYATNSSNVFLDSNTTFVKSDGQTTYRALTGSSVIGVAAIQGVTDSLAATDSILWADYTPVSIGAADTTVYNLTIPGGTYDEGRGFSRTAVKMMKSRTVFTIDSGGVPSNRTFSVKSFGANVPIIVPSSQTDMFVVEVSYRFLSETLQIREIALIANSGDKIFAAERSVDMSIDQNMLLQMRTSNAGDTVRALYTEITTRF